MSKAVKPVRLQRSRKNRLESPNGLPVVCVARPNRWGNPFKAKRFGLEISLALYRETVQGGWDPKYVAALDDGASTEAYALHRRWTDKFRYASGNQHPFSAMRYELSGKNLACWCKLGEPCHADVLLELANMQEPR